MSKAKMEAIHAGAAEHADTLARGISFSEAVRVWTRVAGQVNTCRAASETHYYLKEAN